MSAPQASVFGLPSDDLHPVVETAVGGPVADFAVSVDHEVAGYYGFSAEKLIPTFRYTTPGGARGQVTAFVKRFRRTGPAEAHHYAELSLHGAPIPHMYGALTDAEGHEVLFLEHVGHLSDDDAFVLDDPARFRRWLALVARFGAVDPSPEWQQRHGQTGREWAAGVRGAKDTQTGLWQRARDGQLGDELRSFCREHRARLPDLHALVDRVAEETGALPLTLAHRDLCPENAGVRPGTGEWLALDIEWIGMAPRFFDAACWLGAPDDVRRRCLPRAALAGVFLAEWERLTGERVPADEFLDTTRLLWITSEVHFSWRTGRAIDGVTCWTHDRDEGRRFFRTQILETLRALLREADRMA